MSQVSDTEHLCFIIHSIRPYCFDFNVILALPSGFRYRNRFDRQWIERTVRESSSALSGMRVLLILRDTRNNNLIPVRWAILDSVQLVGGVLYFEYLLGDLIEYSSESNVRDQEIVARTDILKDQHQWLPGPIGAPMSEPSVFHSTAGNGLPCADSSNLTAWGNVIAAIATAPIFHSIEFLKIVGLFGPDGSPAPVLTESLLVEANTVYTLRVFQHVPAPPDVVVPTHSIEINVFPAHIAALRANQQAVGKYDMLTFVLRVLSLDPGAPTAIEIPHTPDIATENRAKTSLYLPLRIRPSHPLRLAITVAILTVSLVAMFTPKLFPFPQDLTRNLATVIFVLTLTGPSRMLTTIWPSWPWGLSK